MCFCIVLVCFEFNAIRYRQIIAFYDTFLFVRILENAHASLETHFKTFTAINIITCFVASALLFSSFISELFCSSKLKFRSTGCFPYESNKKKKTNWNFCETLQHWLIWMFVFFCVCVCYELLFLLLFPRKKWNRTFHWQSFCRKVFFLFR